MVHEIACLHCAMVFHIAHPIHPIPRRMMQRSVGLASSTMTTRRQCTGCDVVSSECPQSTKMTERQCTAPSPILHSTIASPRHPTTAPPCHHSTTSPHHRATTPPHHRILQPSRCNRPCSTRILQPLSLMFTFQLILRSELHMSVDSESAIFLNLHPCRGHNFKVGCNQIRSDPIRLTPYRAVVNYWYGTTSNGMMCVMLRCGTILHGTTQPSMARCRTHDTTRRHRTPPHRATPHHHYTAALLHRTALLHTIRDSDSIAHPSPHLPISPNMPRPGPSRSTSHHLIPTHHSSVSSPTSPDLIPSPIPHSTPCAHTHSIINTPCAQTHHSCAPFSHPCAQAPPMSGALKGKGQITMCFYEGTMKVL